MFQLSRCVGRQGLYCLVRERSQKITEDLKTVGAKYSRERISQAVRPRQ